jgi:hypothetical protein
MRTRQMVVKLGCSDQVSAGSESDRNMLGLKTVQVTSATDALSKSGLIHYDDGEVSAVI